MSIETAGRDPDYVPTEMAMSLGTPHVPTNLWVDETTHRLLVNAVISGGGASDGAIVDGAGSGNKAGVIQSVATPGIYGVVIVNADGTAVGGGGGGGGTQYVDGVAQPAHPTGNALVYGNGSNMIAVSSSTPLPVSGTFWQTTQPVSIASMPSTPVTGTFWQATQPVSGTVSNTPVAPTTIFNGKTTVTTPGTRVTLAASQAVQTVTIKALSSNTGIIYVGNVTVASTNGFQLAAGDTISFDLSNLNTINIDSSVATEGVTYIGVN